MDQTVNHVPACKGSNHVEAPGADTNLYSQPVASPGDFDVEAHRYPRRCLGLVNTSPSGLTEDNKGLLKKSIAANHANCANWKTIEKANKRVKNGPRRAGLVAMNRNSRSP